MILLDQIRGCFFKIFRFQGISDKFIDRVTTNAKIRYGVTLRIFISKHFSEY